jgi:hypothetical protein
VAGGALHRHAGDELRPGRRTRSTCSRKPDRGAISVYARNRDYHDVIKGRLKEIAGKLAAAPARDVKVFVDTAPVMEKPLAEAAGLGWQGKHTNLVSRELGSWLFLGAIFTTAEIERTRRERPLRFLPRLPRRLPDGRLSGALPLDARRCISYLTIENKGPIPHEFRAAMGNRIYGCDDCLAACRALRCPPLSCRTSPPQGGRSRASSTALVLQRWRLAKSLRPADLPPCGGDVRQDRGGQRRAKLRWIGYLSTVGVYGDYQGDWVSEADECRPVSRRSKSRVEAEQAWQTLADDIGKPLAILRLSGIYGPGRNAFVNLENGTAKRLIKPAQVFNRIHAADIAGALWRLASRNTGGVFNVTDDEPAPPQDVVAYAAEMMGVAPPPEIPFETAQLSPMARSFYGENKRVSNRKLKEAGYVFRYPDYRAALSALWRDETWRGEGGQNARSPIKPD